MKSKIQINEKYSGKIASSKLFLRIYFSSLYFQSDRIIHFKGATVQRQTEKAKNTLKPTETKAGSVQWFQFAYKKN